MWVATDDCYNCENLKFHTKASGSYQESDVSIVDIEYIICDHYAGVSARSAEDVFGVAPDYFLARTRFASVKYVWGRMFDGIKDIHGSLGLNYKSFSDPYGYISTLQSLVCFWGIWTRHIQNRVGSGIAWPESILAKRALAN